MTLLYVAPKGSVWKKENWDPNPRDLLELNAKIAWSNPLPQKGATKITCFREKKKEAFYKKKKWGRYYSNTFH